MQRRGYCAGTAEGGGCPCAYLPSLLSSVFLLLLVTLAFSSNTAGQNKPETPEFNVKEHYTKYEYRIPMRDGAHLFTSVYVPKDSSQAYPLSLIHIYRIRGNCT